MKKSYIFIGIFLIFIIIITVVGSIIVTGNIKVSEDKDILLVQSNKEVYFKPYGYDVIVLWYSQKLRTFLVITLTSTSCR